MASQNNYVIGVDGGGTKTTAALADLQGRILRIGRAGPSSPRNVGIETTVSNVAKAIRQILPKKKVKILSVFVGLAAVHGHPERARQIKKELLMHDRTSALSSKKLQIADDQLVAFRSGTDKKEGIVLIAGTGSVARGWRGGKEHKSSGWGWLADEGSAFWIGQKYYQSTLKGFDRRGPKTRLKVPSKIYSQNFIKEVTKLSVICDMNAKKGDKKAKEIMLEAGKELALAAKTVVKELNFSKEKFPVVLVGSVWKSKIVLITFKKEVKKEAPKAEFIQPKGEPVMGAVKLAIEYSS